MKEKIAVLLKCESEWDKVFATIPENRRGTFTWSRSYPCMALHQKDNPNKIGTQTESWYRDSGYTIISAAVYLKEGEVEEFGVGDRVEITGVMDGNDYIGQKGEIISQRSCYYLDKGGEYPLYSVNLPNGDRWNFWGDKIKSAGSATKPKTTKGNDMKDNGIDSNVLAVFGDKVNGNELVVIDGHFTEQMITRILMEKHHKDIQAACKDIEAKRLKEEAKK